MFKRCKRGLIAMLALAAMPAFAAQTEVRLILPSSAKPGETIHAAVQMKMGPGWHTYWKNPGESGSATEIAWELPKGVTAGETQWPLPHKLPPAEIVTYGYEGEIAFVIPLTLASDVPVGPIPVKAKVSWLECMESCLPADAEISATLNVAVQPVSASENDRLITEAKRKVPGAIGSFQASARWAKPADGDKRLLAIEFSTDIAEAEFFPDASDAYEIGGPTELVLSGPGQIHLLKSVKKFGPDWPVEISGTLVTGSGKVRQGWLVKLPIGGKATAGSASPASEDSAAGPKPGNAISSNFSGTLLGNMILALLGGIILNLMPCVLPILSLKILSIVKLTGRDAAIARHHSLIYTSGVLVSFWIIALLVIFGRLNSWGEQFQDVRFIIVITTLMMLISMNLFGVFEFVLPGAATDAASRLASRDGGGGAFFNGMLAVVLGASCVAPVMAGAIGWAMTQSPLIILIIFTMLGLGLALPYLLLSYIPGLRAFMPKPGAWMEKFKMALGFPMLGMAVWSFSLVGDHFGSHGALWVGLFLVFLACAVWIYGEFVQRGLKGKWLAALCSLAFIGFGYAYALESRLDWRHPVSQEINPVEGAHKFGPPVSNGRVVWVPWSPESVDAARKAGRPILVDFTANWCLTCQLNKTSSIEIDAVMKKLTEINAIAMLADFTRKSPSIAAELQRFGRPGVPMVLVYPKDSSKPAKLLPTVLTPGIMLDALDESAK